MSDNKVSIKKYISKKPLFYNRSIFWHWTNHFSSSIYYLVLISKTGVLNLFFKYLICFETRVKAMNLLYRKLQAYTNFCTVIELKFFSHFHLWDPGLKISVSSEFKSLAFALVKIILLKMTITSFSKIPYYSIHFWSIYKLKFLLFTG